MLVRVKEWPTLDKKGHPRAERFCRMLHGGDVFDLPETLVIHEVDSDTEIDPTTKKPIKERVIAHRGVPVNQNEKKDMTELEHRKFTLQNSPEAARWSKEDKERFLKYAEYAPSWMEPAPRNSFPSVRRNDTLPEADEARNIPNVIGDSTTSVGDVDTHQRIVANISRMSEDEAVSIINKCDDASMLASWNEAERKVPGRDRVKNVLKVQMRNVSGEKRA